MVIIGIHKETKEKVYFDTDYSWGNAYHHCLVCKYGEKIEPKLFGIDNRFGIEPTNYDWTIESIEVKNNIHLCLSCLNKYPNCNAENIIFGTGLGNDNIIACEKYQTKEATSFLLELKKIADDVHFYADAENNCELISNMIEEKINTLKKEGGE